MRQMTSANRFIVSQLLMCPQMKKQKRGQWSSSDRITGNPENLYLLFNKVHARTVSKTFHISVFGTFDHSFTEKLLIISSLLTSCDCGGNKISMLLVSSIGSERGFGPTIPNIAWSGVEINTGGSFSSQDNAGWSSPQVLWGEVYVLSHSV